jgi:hypothetical protein
MDGRKRRCYCGCQGEGGGRKKEGVHSGGWGKTKQDDMTRQLVDQSYDGGRKRKGEGGGGKGVIGLVGSRRWHKR